jgi:hypothetical protein
MQEDAMDASVAPSRNRASLPNAIILHRLLESGANVVARRPPINAPTKNAARAVRERNADRAGTPAKSKAKEHDIAGHIGSENMPKGDVTYGIY